MPCTGTWSKPDIWAAQATQALWDTVGLRGTVKYYPDLQGSPGENIKVPLWTRLTGYKRGDCADALTCTTVTQTDKTISMDDYYIAADLCYEEMFETPYIGDFGINALRGIDRLIDTDIIALTGTAGYLVGAAGGGLSYAVISSGAMYLCNVPMGQKFLVIGQTGYQQIVNDDDFIAGKVECCADENTIINGIVGSILGCTVIVSDLVSSGTADGGGTKGLMYAYDGIGFGDVGGGIRAETGYESRYGLHYLHFHYVCGLGLLDPVRVIEIRY